MRKYIYLLLAFIIAVIPLSGCSTKNEGKRQLSYSSHEKNTLYIYYPQLKSFRPSDSQINNWERYMLDKYDFKIDLTYTMSLTESDDVMNKGGSVHSSVIPVSIKNLSTITGDKGFVYIKDYETLNQLIKYDMVIPVQNYISQIPYYSAFDQGKLDNFTDSMGNTWAFPLSNLSPYTSKRIYNKSWLEKAEIGVPETLDEFYEYAKYVTTEDPDSNGEKDSYIMQFTPTTSLRDFMDIFIAFGCYTTGVESVCYNPQLGGYECIFLNENFIDAMNYIMFLWEENLIKCVPMKDLMAGIEQTHKNASSYSSNLTGTVLENRSYGFYLMGNNETKLIEIKSRELCLAVLKFTDNIPEKITKYTEIIQSEPESYMDFSIGIKGVDYFDHGTYYDYLVFEEDRTNIPRIGIINWLNTSILTKKPLIGVSSADKFGTTTNIIPIIESRVAKSSIEQLVNQYLGTALVYSNTFDLYKPDVYSINQSMAYARSKFFKDIFENNISLDDAYAELIKHIEREKVTDRILNLSN